MRGNAFRNHARAALGDAATPNSSSSKLSSRGQGAEVREFIVSLDRSNGKPLGVDVDDTDGQSLLLRSLTSDGLLAAYNATAEPSRMIKSGNRIVEVNGVRGSSSALVQECRKACMLRLRICGA